MKCTCPDWEPNIKKVNGPILLQAARAGRSLYDGEPFVFCPWCGSQLMNDEFESTFAKWEKRMEGLIKANEESERITADDLKIIVY